MIVRYSSSHDPYDEWVYNAADIDGSKVIWAREMDSADDGDLIHYYKDRRVWLVQPDSQPAQISPYPMSRQERRINAVIQSISEIKRDTVKR